MIQAPQAQYIPAQYGMPMMNYQPQGAPQVVQTQQQAPGYIYNYPTTSSYAQPAAKSQYNGVNIEIINPQGQAGGPQQMQAPAQYAMPAQYTIPPMQMMPVYPQFPASQAIVQPAVPQPMPQAPAAAQPMPQVAPVVAPQPQIPAAPVVAPEAQATPANAPAAAPVVEPQVTADPNIKPETFAGKLKTNDLDAQKLAIEEIAENVKGDSKAGPILLDTQIFDALVDIIQKDTTGLEGPTPEVIELRNKPKDQLSAEEKAKAETATPLEKAEINKQYALYTIAFMQDRLNSELVKRNNPVVDLKDLPCIETVVNTVKSNPNPRLRHGAISALSYIAKPEYKADLTQIFELAKADEDATVQEEAARALSKLN